MLRLRTFAEHGRCTMIQAVQASYSFLACLSSAWFRFDARLK
jgi:hypothetical protein